MKKTKLNSIEYKFWLDHQLKFPSSEYNDTNFTFVADEALSVARLKAAYKEIVLAYPPFYSHICVEERIPYFVPDESFETPNFQEIEVPDHENVVNRIQAYVNEPFDLANEYPCRFYALHYKKKWYLLHLFHHVVMDGWTLKVFFDKLSAVYNEQEGETFSSEGEQQSKELFFAAFDREGELNRDEHVEYWRQFLQEYNVQTAIPCLKKENGTDISYSFSLGKEWQEKVLAFCKKVHTTPFRLYASVWALTLSRTSRSEQLLLDHTLNLCSPDNLPFAGVYVNNLPLKFDFSDGNQTFMEILSQVGKARREERKHQSVFYHDFLDKGNGVAQQGGINVAVSYPAKYNSMQLQLKGCQVVPYGHVDVEVGTDLVLVIEDDLELSCNLRYQSRFSPTFIRSLAKVWEEVLKQVVTAPAGLTLGEIHQLSQNQQTLLLEKEDAMLHQAVPAACFLSRFEKVVEKYADRTAIAQEDKGISYEELDLLSDRVAASLLAYGWSHRRIGICAPKSFALIVSIWGVLKSGNTYVPIDEHLPQERINFMQEDCQLAAVLVSQQTETRFEQIPVLQMEEMMLAEKLEKPVVEILPSDEAYIIYTSGTTGKPKAIPIQHSMLNQMIVNHLDIQRQTVATRVMQFSNICFDASIFEIFPVLNGGGTLVLPLEAVRRDPVLLYDFLDQQKISVAYIPPVMLTNLPRKSLPHLQTIMVGGDTCSEQVLKFWSQGRCLINAYGPTENTVDTTYMIVDNDFVKNDIGLSEPGVTCYVLDQYQHLVADEVIGELYVGGVKLTTGYLQRPKLNANVFISNPFVSENDRNAGRNLYLYKTGDLVVRRADGHLIFMGRSDFQVKLHGFRIELEDIETKIGEYGSEVKDCCVLMREVGKGQQLVAYVRVDDAAHFSDRSLRTFLQQKLPAYMVPASFVPMEEFPCNASGKIDRRRLPAPVITSVTDKANGEEWSTPTEKKLAELWQTMLPGQQFGRDDDFLSLGGDSLAVIQMAFSIEEIFGVRIQASEIYRNIIFSSLAETIESKIKEQRTLPVPVENSVVLHLDQHPLSPAQKSLWLQCVQSEEIKDAYNLPCFFYCPDTTTWSDFEEVFNRLVELQDSFRMSFPMGEDGQPYIAVAPYQRIKVEKCEISSEALRSALCEDLRCSFQLEEGPLYRVKCYHIDGTRYCCSLVMHHLISDGWSAKVVEKVMTSFLSGENVDWSEYQGSYLDFVRESLAWQNTENYRHCLDYWRNSLEDIIDLDMLRSVSLDGKEGRVDTVTCPLPAGLFLQVENYCRNHGCTLFDFYCAVFLLLLSRYTQTEKFAIGTPVLGRERGAYQSLVGYFVNILPVAYRGDYNALKFSQYLKDFGESLVEAQQNVVPLNEVLQTLRDENGDQGLQLIQAIFTYENKDLYHDVMDRTRLPFGLVTSLIADGEASYCKFDFQSALFSGQDIESLAQAYLALMQAVLTDADRKVTEYSLAAATYLEEVMNQSVSHGAEPLPSSHFLERFSKVVQTCPDRLALRYNDESVTYAELDEKSDRVADFIRCAQVPDAVSIAVRMAASAESIATIIGILKAGCCYVPIDVDLPKDRFEFILKDAACAMLFDEEQGGKGQRLTDHVMRNPAFDTCAYVIYTSGTTGQPKGVPVKHQALSHLLDVLPERTGINADSKTLLFTSLSFDASVTQIFTTLSLGATLVVANVQQRKDMPLLAALLENENVSYMEIPAAILPLLPRREYPALRTIIVGGETSQLSVLEYWSKSKFVINAYGPTENTVDTSMCVIDPSFEHNDIGLPLSGVSCYVLDKYMNIVPANVKGELYIGGLQLMRGYLHRDDLNAEKLVANPFVQPEDRARGVNTLLYKSGDIVLRRPNGHLIYVGRNDRQVKLRGFRIELSEIENVLMRCHGVGRAVVKIAKGKRGEELVAYVQSDLAVAPGTLQALLRNQLPGYMVPVRWTVVTEFPMTVNGKTDWRRLPEPQRLVCEQEVLPATDDESILLQEVRDLLDTDAIGVETDLIDAGMTSLQVMELVARMSGTAHFRFNISSVYRNRTIRRLLQEKGSNLYYWLDEFQPEKPVMVLVCGFPHLIPFYDKFIAFYREKFNIFVFESFNEYFREKSEISIDLLLEHYLQQLHVALGGKAIDVLTGYCLGSEIALRLAQRWADEGGQKPKVLMMEGTWERKKGVQIPHISDVEWVQQNYEMAQRLIDTFLPIHYDGELLIAFADHQINRVFLDREEETDEAFVQAVHEEMRKAKADWRKAYPEAPYIEVDATHWSFFEDRPMLTLWETLKKYWNLK